MPSPVNLVSTDSVLADPIYATQLKEDLYAMSSQLLTDFSTYANQTTLTSAQQRFVDLTEAYAAYNVAAQCVAALPMFSPITIKDEKAELTRNRDFYTQLKDNVSAALERLQTRLATAYAVINANAPAPATVLLTVGSAIGLGVDPVTGE